MALGAPHAALATAECHSAISAVQEKGAQLNKAIEAKAGDKWPQAQAAVVSAWRQASAAAAAGWGAARRAALAAWQSEVRARCWLCGKDHRVAIVGRMR